MSTDFGDDVAQDVKSLPQTMGILWRELNYLKMRSTENTSSEPVSVAQIKQISTYHEEGLVADEIVAQTPSYTREQANDVIRQAEALKLEHRLQKNKNVFIETDDIDLAFLTKSTVKDEYGFDAEFYRTETGTYRIVSDVGDMETVVSTAKDIAGELAVIKTQATSTKDTQAKEEMSTKREELGAQKLTPDKSPQAASERLKEKALEATKAAEWHRRTHPSQDLDKVIDKALPKR